MQSDSTPNASPRAGLFDRAADLLSYAIGTPWAFLLGAGVVAVWALVGPFADFSNRWQLFINSFTTIVTFLMVFLLGNASNRITASQDDMLERILTEEEQVESEERLIQQVLAGIDARHIRPILEHLDRQDRRLEAIAAALAARGR